MAILSLTRFIHDDLGQDLAEYGLLLAILSLASLVALQALGPAVNGRFAVASTGLSAAGGTGSGTPGGGNPGGGTPGGGTPGGGNPGGGNPGGGNGNGNGGNGNGNGHRP